MTVTARRLGRTIEGIAPEGRRGAPGVCGPGNVRELRNVVERGVILKKTRQLTLRSIVLGRGMAPVEELDGRGEPFLRIDVKEDGEPLTLREVERAYVARVLEHTGWNKTKAAKLLGITFPTIQRKVQDYDLG